MKVYRIYLFRFKLSLETNCAQCKWFINKDFLNIKRVILTVSFESYTQKWF
jgi:hypothetical protein